MGGERGQLSQNIFLDIDFSTTSLAVFLPCYHLWIFFENIFSCWIVYSVGYLYYSRILQIQYPHQAKIFLLYLQIYHQFLESGLTDMRCSTKLLFRSFDSTWGPCRNLRCLLSPLFKFGYSSKAWFADFWRNPSHCPDSSFVVWIILWKVKS